MKHNDSGQDTSTTNESAPGNEQSDKPMDHVPSRGTPRMPCSKQHNATHQQNQESNKPYLPMPEDRPIMTTKIYARIEDNLSQYQTM
jgi:hypothetical protein